jgi:long-chain fatty acid transport protein
MFGPTNQEQRSELGIGRFIVPLAYDVSPTFRLAGSVDYVWGGLDAMMTIDGNTFVAMASNPNNANKRAVGYVNTSSTMLPILGGVAAGGMDYAHLSMSEGTNKFKQELTTSGTAWNIGFQWQATPALGIGAVYHAKTNLSDMAGGATMTIQCSAGNPSPFCAGPGGVITMRGNMRVVNFQWPETYAVGLAYQASDKWLIVGDYKNIRWSDVMQQFHMRFTSGGAFMDMGLNQNWDDQNVFQFGAAYKWDDTITLRFGANLADNPIPNGNLNPLFPATTENHYTLGAGFALSKTSAIDFSLSHAPEVSATNPGKAPATLPMTMAPIPAVATSHSQTNWQLMFSNKF